MNFTPEEWIAEEDRIRHVKDTTMTIHRTMQPHEIASAIMFMLGMNGDNRSCISWLDDLAYQKSLGVTEDWKYKRTSCDGKVVEIEGKKYQLKEVK